MDGCGQPPLQIHVPPPGKYLLAKSNYSVHCLVTHELFKIPENVDHTWPQSPPPPPRRGGTTTSRRAVRPLPGPTSTNALESRLFPPSEISELGRWVIVSLIWNGEGQGYGLMEHFFDGLSSRNDYRTLLTETVIETAPNSWFFWRQGWIKKNWAEMVWHYWYPPEYQKYERVRHFFL